MPKITHNRAFPHENDEFDILVGTFDEDDRGDEDDATLGFDDKQDGSDVLSVHFDGTDGNDQAFGGPNDDTLKGGKGLDALYGEGGDDWIYGGEDRDWLFGGDNDDYLFGQGGPDEMYGDSGEDELDGGESNDLLDGGPGEDILVGGEGADWLTGGSGPDRFLFNFHHGDLVDPDSPSSNPDMIMDFDWKESDIVVVEGYKEIPSFDNYTEATIGYGAGYNDAKDHAETLLTNSGKAYAFVTDEVDGYLFVGAQTGLPPSGKFMGIILVGLNSESDFEWTNLWPSL